MDKEAADKDAVDKEKIPGSDAGDLFFAGSRAAGGRRAGTRPALRR